MAELADEPRFITQAKRAQNQKELVNLLAPQFKLKSAAEWLAEMDRRQVPCAPINDFADILHDPHVAHMGLVKLRIAKWRAYKTVGFPVSIAGSSTQKFSHPALGADNQAICDEWLRLEQISQTIPDK